MITLTVSFKPSGSSAEAIAQLVKLLAELENSATIEPNSESGSSSVETEVKSAKSRKVRVYTDEQKAAFRARMVAAREAKKGTDQSTPTAPVKKVETQPVEPVKNHGSKKLVKSNKVSMLPRTGQKVGAKPAAQ